MTAPNVHVELVHDPHRHRAVIGWSADLALLRATAEQHPRPPHEANHAVPLAFSQLIMRLLQKKPECRYASARDLVSAFEILRLLFRH